MIESSPQQIDIENKWYFANTKRFIKMSSYILTMTIVLRGDNICFKIPFNNC